MPDPAKSETRCCFLLKHSLRYCCLDLWNAAVVNVLLFSRTVRGPSGPEVRITRADANGRYEIGQVSQGDYVLCVNGRGYADSCRWRQPETIKVDRGDVNRDLRIDPGVRIEAVFVDDQLLLEKAQGQKATMGLLEVSVVRAGGFTLFGALKWQKGVWVFEEVAPTTAVHDVQVTSHLLKLANHRGDGLGETSKLTASPPSTAHRLMFGDPPGVIRLRFRVAGLTPAGSALIQ